MTEDAINAFVTLLVVVDPVGLLPVFIALTQGAGAAERRRLAARACAIATGILLLFGLAGDAILAFIGISMPAFRIAGGLVLFLTALDMLFERRQARRARAGESLAEADTDPSVFPLAIPLLAGPGAIASMILLRGEHTDDAARQAMVFGTMLVVMLSSFGVFLLADPLARLLGRTGNMVVTRLLGMLLAALSVQFVLDGIAQSGLALRG